MKRGMVFLVLLSTLLLGSCTGEKLDNSYYYVRSDFKDTSSQIGKYKDLEEAKKAADENAVYGCQVYDSKGNVVHTTYSEFTAKILHEAKKITDYVRDNGFIYGDAPINPAIDHTAKKVSCDRFVSWTMYDVGFTDQPHTSGLFVYAGGGDERDLTNWCIKNGFIKITDVSELRPGDIMFVNPSKTSKGTIYPGHTFIHAGEGPDAKYYRYDCGSDTRIQSTQPSCEYIMNFMYAYRPVEKK